MILDSGERTVHPNGFQRDMHEGKGRMDLLPWRAIIEVSKHCEEGAKKYGERNIDKGCPQHSLIDSAFRHLAKYTIGMTDEDHLRACAWNILWALEQEVCRPDMQDIPARMSETLEEVRDSNITLMNEELDKLSAKHPGAGYQSGIRRGIRETREIFEKYMAIKMTPEATEDQVHATKWYDEEFTHRRCVEMTCFYNADGICQSETDRWCRDYGKDCPDFSED